MAVPQINGVHLVVYKHVEILNPLLLVVQPRKEFGRVGIFVNHSARQKIRFLNADARSAQNHLGSLTTICRKVEVLLGDVVVCQLNTAVESSAAVGSDDCCHALRRCDAVAFFLQRIGSFFKHKNKVSAFRNGLFRHVSEDRNLYSLFGKRRLQLPGTKLNTVRSRLAQIYTRTFLCPDT